MFSGASRTRDLSSRRRYRRRATLQTRAAAPAVRLRHAAFPAARWRSAQLPRLFRRPCFSGSAQARPKDNERGKEDHRNDKNIRQQTLAEAAFFFGFSKRSPRPRRDFLHGRGVRGARFSFPVRDAPDEQASLPARGVPDARVCPPARDARGGQACSPARDARGGQARYPARDVPDGRAFPRSQGVRGAPGPLPARGALLSGWERASQSSPPEWGGGFKGSPRGPERRALPATSPPRAQSRARRSPEYQKQLLLADGGSALGARQARFALPARAGYRFSCFPIAALNSK